jgi:hypothetical protein
MASPSGVHLGSVARGPSSPLSVSLRIPDPSGRIVYSSERPVGYSRDGRVEKTGKGGPALFDSGPPLLASEALLFGH